jgi:transcriptional regulator with XRE-family HTH domain
MAITDTIAANLSVWMEHSADLNTLKKLASRSGVGFGTVQRVKNGNGNPTVKNLTDIAKAFGRRPEDLLILPGADAPAAPGGLLLTTKEAALLENFRLLLDEDQQRIEEDAQKLADVARAYRKRFGAKIADNHRVSQALTKANKEMTEEQARAILADPRVQKLLIEIQQNKK